MYSSNNYTTMTEVQQCDIGPVEGDTGEGVRSSTDC